MRAPDLVPRAVQGAIALVVAALGATAAAQAGEAAKPAALPDLRTGFYAGAGAAWGSAPVSATVSSEPLSDTQQGFSFYVAAGTGLNAHWRAGAEWDLVIVTDLFSGSTASSQDGSISFFSAAIAYYPSLTSNFWVKGNLGWAKLSVSSFASGATSETGLAGGLGVGYDWRLGRSEYVLVPFANYFTQFSASGLNGFLQNDGSAKVSLFQVGVGLGYHH